MSKEAALLAFEIVEAIERDICKRSGLRQEWESIDDAVLADIRNEWSRLIMEIYG